LIHFYKRYHSDSIMADDSVIAEFQSITGCDVERAKFYLESANMQLDLAISSFYESGGMETDEPVPENLPSQGEGGVPAAAGGGAPAAPTAPVSGKINFLDDDSDSEDEGQAFYAGGSSNSGNVILGPGKKKENKDIVGKIFRRAKESGASEVRPGEEGASGSRAFQGGGFRLGSSETAPSEQVGAPMEKEPEQRTFVLKMWQDGFSIDDGDLREYSNPANREFLAQVMKGSIPQELVSEAKGGVIQVDMEDHRNEEFVKPKKTHKPFQGSGQVLGSIAPQVTVPSQTTDPAQAEAQAKSQAKVDEAQPTTNIQVRLADGSRLIVKLNHTHTVANLRSYISTARNQYASVPFALLTTFPNKELTDDSQTLKDAGLLGAAVLQRLK